MDIPAVIPPLVQPWVPSVRNCHGYTRADVEAMVLRCVAAVRAGATVNPARCGTDAKVVLGLWSALGHPEPSEMAGDVELVAAWAQQSPDPAAARAIRAEGWAEGTDRSRKLSTLTVQASWGDRLDAAQRWAKAGRPQASDAPKRPDANRRPVSLIEAFAADHAQDDDLAIYNSDSNIFKFPTLVAK